MDATVRGKHITSINQTKKDKKQYKTQKIKKKLQNKKRQKNFFFIIIIIHRYIWSNGI